ncbi:flavin reductase [Streptomyces sp. SPB074]|nr:flavin reductase [Streptomyces sp. SPB074]
MARRTGRGVRRLRGRSARPRRGRTAPRFPAFGSTPPPATAAALERVTPVLARADAFVVVTPEYNHSYPASLKNVIDWHNPQWHAKPVAFVSYGGLSGGLRAVEHLRPVFAEVHAVTVRDTISFHGARERFAEDGSPKDPESVNTAAETLLTRLEWWARSLAESRAKRPYTVRPTTTPRTAGRPGRCV